MAREPREVLMFLGLNFISYRVRSRKEIIDYLKKQITKKKYDPGLLEVVSTRLEEMGYIDDQKFAEAWVDGRRRGKKKGISALKMELNAKGIDTTVIESVLGSRDHQEELELARSAVAKKVVHWQKLPTLACKKKVYEYLRRRGFSSSIAITLVDETCPKAYNTDSEI
jgi:regulatory protein